MRKTLLILAVLAVLSTIVASPAIPPSTMPLPSIPNVHAATRSIVLIGNGGAGWNSSNPSITVNNGDSVSVALSSGDGAAHTFVVDVDRDGKVFSPTCPPDKCSLQFPPPTTYSFMANFAGSYVYYCTFHPNTMFGTFTVLTPDYSVASSPSSLSLAPGAKANSTITVNSIDNFAGSVTLSSPPSGLTTSFSANSVTVPSGGTGKSNLTISVPMSTSPGPYSVAVTASNSTTSRSTAVTVNVTPPSFSISANPTSLTINSGNSGTSTITVTGFNGFSGTVNLSPAIPPGRAHASLSLTSLALSPTATSATSTLTVSSALGAFNVTVAATSGETHSTFVTVDGPDFKITTSSSTINVSQGSSTTLTVTLSSRNGFSGAVNLTALASSGSPPVMVTPASLQVPSSGNVSATLTVTASSSGAYSTPPALGSYTVTLNATTGSLFHSTAIPLTVTSASSGFGVLTNPLVIGGIVAVIGVATIVAFVLHRRSNP